jgi:hypothetical protein
MKIITTVENHPEVATQINISGQKGSYVSGYGG